MDKTLMRRLIILIGLYALAGCFPAHATTKIRLHNDPSPVNSCKSMTLSLGPPNIAQDTAVTTTTAGGTDIQMTKTAGGTALCWASEPLAAGFTLQAVDGNVIFNVYGGESAATVNAAFRGRLFRWTGSLSAAITLAEMSTELTTTLTTVHNWNNTTTAGGSITTTTFNTGDRIVLELFDENCATSSCPTGSMAAGTTTAHYDGPTDAADGSSWVQIPETVTFTPDGGSGGTPAFVQSMSTPNVANGGQILNAGQSATVPLPSLSQAGNFIGIYFWYQAGTVWSVTDDQSNTYTLGPTCSEAGNVTQVAFYYAENVAASTRVLTVSHTTGNAQFFAAIAFEAKNIATSGALDASACSSSGGGSTTPSSGAMTPLTSGDLLAHFFANETNISSGAITVGTDSNITWAFTRVNDYDGHAMKGGVYSSTSAITPTMTQTANTAWVSAAVSLKSSTSGSDAPAGWYIRGAQHEVHATGSTTPYTIQMPTVGTLLVDAYGGGNTDCISGITSTNPSITFANTGACKSSTSNHVTVVTYYGLNSAPSGNTSLSITMNQTSLSDDGHELYDVVGNNTTTPFASNDVTNIGNKTGVTPLDTMSTANSSGCVSTCNTFTPAHANSFVVTYVPVDFNTINAITTPSGCLLQNGFHSVNGTGNTNYYENNGWATCISPAASSMLFEWTMQSGLAANTGEWATRADEFLAPASAVANHVPPMIN